MTTKLSQEFINACLKMSDDEHSKVSQREHEIFGLSSKRLRCFLNNLCSKDNTNLLEIGTYRGSTLLSALYGNPGCKAVSIDNFKYDPREPTRVAQAGNIWSNVKSQLDDNINRYRHQNSGINIDNIQLITGDFQKVTFDEKQRFNVCFFDVEPVTSTVYDDFFENTFKYMSLNSVIVFTQQSKHNTYVTLDEALIRHQDKFDVEYSTERLSGGMSDGTKYYSGIRVIIFKKKFIKEKVNDNVKPDNVQK